MLRTVSRRAAQQGSLHLQHLQQSCAVSIFSRFSTVQRWQPEAWPSVSLPIEQAATPPSSWYTDPRMLAHEQRTVFTNSWMLAGYLDDLSSPGSYITGQLLFLRYLVCRDQDGELRAFHNVCRHHAAAVASGEGCTQQFVCPYHGWTYGLDGRLAKATRLRGIQNFKASENGLVPLRCGTWGPFAFITPNDSAPDDVLAWMGPGGQVALDSGLTDMMSDMRLVKKRSWTVPCNWKVFVDNYLDGGYHVPHAHPGLAQGVDMDSYRTALFGRVSIQTCGSEAEDERLTGGNPVAYIYIYPNLMINVYGPWIDVNIVKPVTIDTCEVEFWYFIHGSRAGHQSYITKSLQQSAKVQDEDIALCRAVQEGLQSTAYDVGRYAPQVEHPMFEFHKLLHQDVQGGKLGDMYCIV